ncbi:high affinity cationic amino acid transporter 1 [Nilaparvata lugens]|uniref:high affinity cationic amino acid transporter 1 n=1 Tax=Nilaparvata lugens TaxID=108931 RepID=UPI000B991CF7|nr:high affinity cationic amino acid transporter 1 [Nilaparvata lugens]
MRSAHLIRVLTRRKTDDRCEDAGTPKLARVLGLFDLCALGVGSTLGVGVYVLAGAVARHDSGPAVTLSFLVAAIASAFAGVCYAEFAARVPKAGSAYVYSYVSVGELIAFIIGWNLVLEYIIGTASVARGFSNYVDSIMGNVMRDTLTEYLPLNMSFLSPYPDFLSCTVVLVLSLLLAWGVKESTLMNNIFTIVNLITVVTVIVCGSMKADLKNWSLHDVPAKAGSGGFMPFGISGVMAGAAKCFYGFIGFDCVATTAEEAKNPQRNIPLSIIFSLIIIFLSYFGIATVLTMMYPYYLQDPYAPLPYAFEKVGMPAVKVMVTVGAIFALCASLLGSLFPLPRMIYAMAIDGLLFRKFALIHPKWLTPINATLFAGFIGAIMAALFNLEQLIDMMSIGTLLAYTIVAMCILVLRYRDVNPTGSFEHNRKVKSNVAMDKFVTLFNLTSSKHPSSASEQIANWSIALLIASLAAVCLCLIHLEGQIVAGSYWAISLLSILSAISLIVLLVIYRQPQNDTVLSFKAPGIPLVPALSIFMNTFLMLKLDMHTWIRFSIWLFIGMIIYIFYSIPNSVEGLKDRLYDNHVKLDIRSKSDNKYASQTTKL